MNFNELRDKVHANSVEKGFWNQPKCITFNEVAQDALPEHVKAKMKADRDKARAERIDCHAYCKHSNENDGLHFDAGYIEAIRKGQRFTGDMLPLAK